MRQYLSIEEKSEIFAYYKSGKTQNILASKYGVSQSTISKIIRRKLDFGSNIRKIGTGRKFILSESNIAYLKQLINKTPNLGSIKLKNILAEKKNVKVSARTIRRTLCSVGLPGRVACHKPLLSPANKISRFDHAKKWIYWNKNAWDKVIWSDETRIELFGSDGRTYIRREKGKRYEFKNLKPTIKHGGGGIMVWGCFSSAGVGRICIIDGIMDSLKYTKILDSNLDASAQKLGLSNYIFQQDNDPKHRSKYTREFLNNKQIELMSWPSQSPDMNPIEHLWGHLKKKIKARNPRNINDLKVKVCEEWCTISKDFCEKLVDSMPKRAEKLFYAKGGHTSY